MTFFLVTQAPKPKYRGALATCAMIVEATTKAAAIRFAVDKHKDDPEKWFHESPDFCKPTAQPLSAGVAFRI